MAKIRAYKIAEELGIDRNELVEKARTFGIELKNPMAPLEDAEADLLRTKLGGAVAVKKGDVVEERVETQAGAAVIRRRKRAVATPEPAPPPPASPLEEGAHVALPEPEAPALEPAAVAAGPPEGIEPEPGD